MIPEEDFFTQSRTEIDLQLDRRLCLREWLGFNDGTDADIDPVEVGETYRACALLELIEGQASNVSNRTPAIPGRGSRPDDELERLKIAFAASSADDSSTSTC